MSWFSLRGKQEWVEVPLCTYQEAYSAFGGSVATHPDFIQSLSHVTGIDTTYLAYYQGETLKGAIAVWGRYLAGNKKVFSKMSCRQDVDLGNAEIILPLARNSTIQLDYKGDYISEINSSHISGLKLMSPNGLGMLKSYSQGEFSKKFKYNQRREKRLLEETGATFKSIQSFTNQEIVEMYRKLFSLRFGKSPKGIDRLEDFLVGVGSYLFGYVLLLEGDPIAIQIVYLVETVDHISAEYINGGVNPKYSDSSPGSVLTFINTQAAEEFALAKNKPLRYSFGKAEDSYKSRWCHTVPVFRC
jgi:hypothetical protein